PPPLPPPSTPQPSPPLPGPPSNPQDQAPLGSCGNPHNVTIANGEEAKLESIDTCSVPDTNSGFLRSLEGKDYAVLLEPSADAARMVTVTASESRGGLSAFDTFLVASKQCTMDQTLNTVVVYNDDAEGLGTYSSFTFVAEKGTSYFLILSGYEDACGLADLLVQARLPPSPPSPTPPGIDGPLGSCENPQVVNVRGGEEVRLRDINTCAATNANDGEQWNLQGKDYVLRLSPQSGPRIVTVTTVPTESSGERYDAYLLATRVCTESRSFGQWIVEGDDNGDGLLSTVTWSVPPNQAHFIVVEGYGDSCGTSDVLVMARTPSPPSPPMPPQAPLSPPPPPICRADRATAPNQGRRLLCSVHNDPHVITFDNVYQTCNTTGFMDLLTNEHFRVTAEAVPIRSQSRNFRGASIIQSVTVTYKDPVCGGTSTYDTTAVWSDEALATTVRMTGHTMSSGQPYLSVRITTPWVEGSGTCVNGCPEGDSVNSWFSRRSLLEKEGEVAAKAAEQCASMGLKEGFLDSCIFDIAATGDDKSFLEASAATENEFESEKAEVEAENEVFVQSAFRPPSPPPNSLESPQPTASPSPSPSPSPSQSPKDDGVELEPEPSPAPSDKDSSNQDAVIGGAVGGAVGGTIFLASVAAVAIYLLKKRRHAAAGQQVKPGSIAPEPPSRQNMHDEPSLAESSAPLPPPIGPSLPEVNAPFLPPIVPPQLATKRPDPPLDLEGGSGGIPSVSHTPLQKNDG
ncbi:hypothetical protein DUNSADRAFT_4278, partial [Dunaliella salina]